MQRADAKRVDMPQMVHGSMWPQKAAASAHLRRGLQQHVCSVRRRDGAKAVQRHHRRQLPVKRVLRCHEGLQCRWHDDGQAVAAAVVPIQHAQQLLIVCRCHCSLRIQCMSDNPCRWHFGINVALFACPTTLVKWAE